MDDALEDVARRLGRLEQLLARTEPGGDLRSARTIVRRLDDVWAATTEGNERTAAALTDLAGRLAAIEAVAAQLRAGLADLDRQVAASARAQRRQRRAAGSGDGTPPPT